MRKSCRLSLAPAQLMGVKAQTSLLAMRDMPRRGAERSGPSFGKSNGGAGRRGREFRIGNEGSGELEIERT